MKSGIYALCDPRTNQLRYIGLSKNINKRYKQHCKLRSYNLDHEIYLTKWLKNLSINNLVPELIILEECSIENLKEKEIFWIAYYKGLGTKLTNLTNGGEGILGYKHTDETLKKIEYTFFKKNQKPWNTGTTGICKAWNKGLKTGPNEAVSKAQTGKKHSKEHIEKRVSKIKGKISKLKGIPSKRKNYKASERTLEKQRNNSVFNKKIIDQNENIYISISDASRKLNISRRDISQVLNNKRINVKGYIFKYA